MASEAISIGRKYGMLTVLSLLEKRVRGRKVWMCQCGCGKTSNVVSDQLSSGKTRSCGCLRILSTTHGMTGTPTYLSWRQLMRRCYGTNSIRFKNYGGRGIKVCDSWHDFKNFYNDMGEKPTQKHTIDRIDNNGNYEPSNCRWATEKQQQNNRSNNRKITHKGETHTVAEWADITGLDYKLIHNRIAKGLCKDNIFKEAQK